MPEYLVEWSINIDGENPVDAAYEARDILRDPNCRATVFQVTEYDGEAERSFLIDTEYDPPLVLPLAEAVEEDLPDEE